MSDKFTFGSAGEAQEVEFALARNEWTHPLLKKATQGGFFGLIREVVENRAKVVSISEDATRVVTINATTIAVNLGATPNLPFDKTEVEEHVGESWTIVEKRADGLFEGGHKLGLYLSKRQKNGRWLKGYELRDELTGKPALNVNLLDALLQNPYLIPEDWKLNENGNTQYVFFWGTIYRGTDGNFCVRFLYFHDGRWQSHYSWLNHDWRGNYPAALRAS